MNNIELLQNIKKKCEQMTFIHQKEILRILIQEKNISLNENNNGTFINLTELDNNVINKLNNFISYVNNQEEHLKSLENEKSKLQETFF